MGVEFVYGCEEGHSPSRREICVLNHTARLSPATTITYIDKLKLRLKGLQWYVSSSLPCKHSDSEVPNEAKKSLRKQFPPLEIDFISLSLGMYMTGHPTISRSGIGKSDAATYESAVMHELLHETFQRQRIHT